MVDLPKVQRRLVTVEAPRSGLSARDIAAPYASMAQAMGEGGEALTATAEAHVEDAAARAVTVGPDGQINVERTAIPMVGPAGKKYENYIKIGAVARADAEADRDLIELRANAKGDPAGFMAAGQEYRDRRVASLSETAGPAAGAALGRQIDNRITQSYGSLVNEHQTKALARADTDLDYRIKTLENEAETLARRNGIGPEFQEKIENIRALRDLRVGNPHINYPQARADAEMDALNTCVQGAAILEQTERVYREGIVNEDGTRTAGFEAARTYLKSATSALGGKVKQVDTIERAGLAWLKSEESGMRAERFEVGRAWSTARPQAANLPAETLVRMEEEAIAAGNFRVATEIRTTRAALDVNAQIRALPVQEQAAIARGGATNLVDRIVGAESGGDPNARATTSTATGAGQFIKGTWLDIVKRNRPDLAQGKTDEQILALRTDPALSREMVGRYAEENKQKLTAAGVAVNDGALYLAHFLGPGDAIKVLAAPPGTPLAGLVNQASIDANRSIFGRNPTTDALTGWAAGKVGAAPGAPVDLTGSRVGLAARQMLIADLRKDFAPRLDALDDRVKRGEMPSQDDIMEIGAMASVVGTPQQRRRVAEIAVMATAGAEFQQLSAAKRNEAISAMDARLKAGGTQLESDLTATLRKADADITAAYQKDAYGAYYRYGRGENARPTPAINFGDPQETALILKERVKQQSVIREEQGIGPFSVLRPSEAEEFRGVMATGGAQAVTASLAGLNALPDDVLAATLANKDVKDGITNAIHTTDHAKMSAVMSTLDTWYRRDPQAFNARFPGAWDALVTWRDNTRYMTPEQFTAHQTKIRDPGQAAIHKKNVEAGRTEALKTTPADLASEMSPFFSTLTGTTVQVPTDPSVRDRYMADYVNIYSEQFANTLDKGIAKAQTLERLGQKWTRSPVNGNEVMLRAPESVYPAVNGTHDWIAPQLEAAVAERLGVPRLGTGPLGSPGLQSKNWDYRIVSDAGTEQEAQRYDRRLPAGDGNKPPSYQVIVRDNRRANPKWEPMPGRFAFDPNAPVAGGREKFEAAQGADRQRRDAFGRRMETPGEFF